jgi:Helix-turn-helix domain
MTDEMVDVSLLTEKDFAKAVNLAPITIRKRRSKGLLPHYRFGRSVRYSWAMVEEFKERHRRGIYK